MNNIAKVITITTPKKYILNGLWFGPDKPDRVLIFIHGLTATAFSNHKISVPLSDQNTAVITFSNRGHDKVAKLKKIDKRKKKGYRSIYAGEALEVFTDCVDDIQGAVDLIKAKGVNKMFLIGHSTGCQKSIYYLSRQGKQKQVNGVVLLCPVSDYAASSLFTKKQDLNKILSCAKKMKYQGKENDLLPGNIWPDYHSAQRFLSLYTPDSDEEIFTYAQSNKIPNTLQRVKLPTLAVFAGNDKYHDRPTKRIVDWFKENSRSSDLSTDVVNNAPHNFNGYEDELLEKLQIWLNKH